ncbi:hypothetical protein [Kitasatospora sp. SUK 42]|uniref:hypothetical protein n=1 Tax=Kitasatospora sp. SUK 42 TaxID=1588882 RepID=UPI0018C98456|nr:hypothetical protein [Kitasatospora sp. SUK 42]MBV2152513.1 hypothetical protein [Kitasatospora sp. SUK 42]
MSMADSTVAVRTALAFYPGRYRRERGDELAVVFADTTAEAGVAAKVRELLDLGAYGLRMRTGLTSTSRGGRLAVLAAPLVAGAAGGLAAGQALLNYLESGMPIGGWGLLHLLPYWALLGAAMLSAVAALLGRWTAAKLLAGVSALAAGVDLVWSVSGAVVQPLWYLLEAFQWDGPFVLWALLLLAAPKDALPVPTWRERGLLLAAAVLTPVAAFADNVYTSWYELDTQWRALMIVVPLLMALTAVRGWYQVSVLGLAVLPWALGVNLHGLWQQEGGAWKLLPMAVATVSVAIALALVGRRKGPDGRQLA